MSYTKFLLSMSLLAICSMNDSHAGSYSFATGYLILDRVKVDTATAHYYGQMSLKYSEKDGSFTSAGIMPLTDNNPSADATLTLDGVGSQYVLTVLNASGYYGVLTSKSLEGPFTLLNVLNVQTNTINSQGIVGPKGKTGPIGPKGDQGDIGSSGLKGDQGDAGSSGLKGDKGDTGLPGLKGDQGDTGSPGLKGDKGDTGLTGLKGDQGDAGSTGLKGDKGDNGAPGSTGNDGVTVTVNN